MPNIADESFVTLATTDNYVLGALNLAQSLRNVNTQRSLTVLTTHAVSAPLVDLLRQTFDHVVLVDVLDSGDSLNLSLLKRPDLGVTFTKLHCWRLVQFTKCVFLDADTFVLHNVDDLFGRDEFSAAADVGWPDCFNSGVFVYRPSLETYSKLLTLALEHGSFDGGDQGLLNLYFDKWSVSEASKRLPFIYNMTTNVSYSYAPAYKKFSENVKIVHFIGAQKPWYYTYNLDTHSVVGNAQLTEVHHLSKWWSTFVQFVLPRLDSLTRDKINVQLVRSGSSSGSFLARDGSYHAVGSAQAEQGHHHQHQYATGSVSSGGVIVGSEQHQTLWEQGKIEYTGRDSFNNIQAHLDSQIKTSDNKKQSE